MGWVGRALFKGGHLLVQDFFHQRYCTTCGRAGERVFPGVGVVGLFEIGRGHTVLPRAGGPGSGGEAGPPRGGPICFCQGSGFSPRAFRLEESIPHGPRARCADARIFMVVTLYRSVSFFAMHSPPRRQATTRSFQRLLC